MKRIFGPLTLITLFVLLWSVPAMANHMAGATLNWSPNGGVGKIKFSLIAFFDRSEMANAINNPNPPHAGRTPEVGDILQDGDLGMQLYFGDGTSTPLLRFQVTNVDAAHDIIRTVALEPGTNNVAIPKTYSSTASAKTAYVTGCCRIISTESNNRFLNSAGNYGEPWRLETIVTFDGNNSPVNTSPMPIVFLCEQSAATFTISAVDPDGDPIRYRLATNAEATGCGACTLNDAPPPGLVPS
jgi:hypothetical protein